MKTYYLFQAESGPELQAFTDDPAGDKLSVENGPWTLVRQISSEEDWLARAYHPVGQAAVRHAAGRLSDRHHGGAAPGRSERVCHSRGLARPPP
jgi:hypothetical protein